MNTIKKKSKTKKEPTTVISKRVKKIHAEKLNTLFDEVIKQHGERNKG